MITNRPTEAALRQQYWAEGKTQQEIADRIGVANTTVHKWMLAYGIPRRPRAAHFEGKKRPWSTGNAEALAAWRAAHPEAQADHNRRVWPKAQRAWSYKHRPLWKPCQWCGEKKRKARNELKFYPVTCCGKECRLAWARHRRWHPDEPRPLILERLRNGDDPQEIGASETEIIDLAAERLQPVEAVRW